MKINLTQIEQKIGYTFNNKDFLLQALTHSSFAHENKDSTLSDNEVLEFLGDSVLGFIVADFLYSSYPELSEGDLSKLKAAVTNTTSLYNFSREINLDKNIFLGKGEEKNKGRKKKTILAGAFESLIAAIYLDGGINEVKNFLIDNLKSFFKRINVEKFFINNYKSALQEYLHRENLPAPSYKILTEKGPNHKKSFTIEVLSNEKILAKAKGHSKKDAEQKAAKKALKNLFGGKKIKSLTSNTFFVKRKS